MCRWLCLLVGATAPDDPHVFVPIGFVDNLPADEHLEHVLETDDAGEPAVFVDNAEQVLPLLDELVQKQVSRRSFRYEADRLG